MPQYRQIRLSLLTEPPAPVRAQMDESKLNELAADLRLRGVLQPLLVRAVPPPDSPQFIPPETFTPETWEAVGGRYEVVVGHRRQLAARLAYLETVPCMVHSPTERCGLGETIAENFLREDVTAAEEGWALAEYIEAHKPSEAELCALVGQSVSWINERLDLVRNDAEIAEAVAKRQITFAVAKELLRVNPYTAALVTRSNALEMPDSECGKIDLHRRYLLRLAVDSGCTARVARSYVEQWKQSFVPMPAAPPPEDPMRPGSEPTTKLPCCITCGDARDQDNLRQFHVHWYHFDLVKELLKAGGVEVHT
jgi:ParB-like chromosome segregation protein Spo0J